MTNTNTPQNDAILDLGWEEWVGLPGLSLPAIKAKIDTGTRTSALHAVAIEPFGTEDKPQVRFIMHPDPDDMSVHVICSAHVIDRRSFTRTNGETELRYVIMANIKINNQSWPIEISLTNREAMEHRMLLGRAALRDNCQVMPASSFLQPQLSFKPYKKRQTKSSIPRRPLRIAILTQEPYNYSNQRIIEAAEARGHTIECIETSRCYMEINAHKPDVHYNGKALPRYDAIIPRIGSSITFYGMAVVRQFESMGVYCLNTSAPIGMSRDKLQAHQILSAHGLDMPATAFAKSGQDTKELLELVGGAPAVVKLLESTQGKGVVLAETRSAASALIDAFRGLNAHFLVQEFIKEANGSDVRCFVVQGKVVGAMIRTAQKGEFRSNVHQGGTVKKTRLTKDERRAAIKAAKIMQLDVAGVDILRSDAGPKILEVNSSPGLQGIEEATKKDIAGAIVECIETNVPTVFRTSFRQSTKTNKLQE
ncbi:MAG: 30S ribosomal protein S6--L-glutamate ligase [Litorimonas sp.]